MLRSVYFLFILAFLHSSAFSSDIVINEIGASSFKNYFDEDHDDSDWIELYNKSDDTINIKDYKIYDKNKVDKAWVFPDTVIYPKGFLRIFASDKDRTSSNNYFVTESSFGNVVSTKSDNCTFKYLKVNNDFEISVKINSLVSENYWATAGIMVRENLQNDAKGSFILSTPDNSNITTIVFRKKESEISQRIDYQRRDFPYNWYKIKRVNDSIFYFIKEDGYTWNLINEQYQELNDTLFVGISTSLGSLDNDNFKRSIYSELEINGQAFNFELLSSIHLGNQDNSNNESFYSKELHTNFKLSIDGESLFLWDKDMNLIDSITFPNQYSNVSYGRYPDGSLNVGYMYKISPEIANTHIYEGVANTVKVSYNSSWYNAPISVSLSSDISTDKIYYTLDGSEPSISSNLYIGKEILIDKNTSLKAKIIKENYLNNFTICRSYFINENFRLPVLAMSIDSIDLWSDEIGLFVDKNVELKREIKVYFDFYNKSNESIFSACAGGKLQGNTTRYDIPQKSLKFYSRDYYGNNEFNFKFWDNQINKVIDKFELKSGGQDWHYTFLRDAFTSCFIEDFKHVLIMEKRPIETYINGKYWGTYILRGKFDENFISERYDVDDESVNYLEDDSNLEQGNVAAYIEMINKIKNMDLVNDSIFNLASSNIDLDNFQEYTIFRVFSAIWDWPGYNHKIWNSPEFDNKWRFVLHDFDISFGYVNADDSQNLFVRLDTLNTYFTTIYKSLLKNKLFKNKFLNTFADHLNNVFLKEKTIKKLDSLANIYSIAVKAQQIRWNESIKNWENELEVFREFLRNRPKNVYNQIVNEFKTDSLSRVTISQNIANTCEFKLNTLSIKDSTWSGTYFADIPIKISCIPKEGYKFYRWAGDTVIYEQNIEILPGDSLNLVAELIEEGKVSVEQVNKEIKVYPNPVSNLLIIELANFDKSDFKELPKIRILDVLGKEVLNFNLNEISNKHKLEFDISSLSPGAYIIKIGEITNKFIKL